MGLTSVSLRLLPGAIHAFPAVGDFWLGVVGGGGSEGSLISDYALFPGDLIIAKFLELGFCFLLLS